MQTRYRAAATALLLTATAGLAATGGAAQASGTHHTSDRAAKSLTVTITSSGKGVKLSDSRIRPGNTTFKVVRGKHGGGLLQVLRLRKGYSLADAFGDFAAAFPDSGPPDVAAVRRIDKNVVFYGGMEAVKGSNSKWAVNIDHRGRYLVANLDKNTLTTLKVKGKHQRRSMPSADGKLNVAPGNVWKPGKHNAHKGWMNTTNRAAEPHFVDMEHVKKGTTLKDIQDFFADPQHNPPPFAKDGASADTGVISPGHTFRWKFSVPKGRYFSACFWPSKVDGTPHAFMGMLDVFNLH
jgi:hypothetical protein